MLSFYMVMNDIERIKQFWNTLDPNTDIDVLSEAKKDIAILTTLLLRAALNSFADEGGPQEAPNKDS